MELQFKVVTKASKCFHDFGACCVERQEEVRLQLQVCLLGTPGVSTHSPADSTREAGTPWQESGKKNVWSCLSSSLRLFSPIFISTFFWFCLDSVRVYNAALLWQLPTHSQTRADMLSCRLNPHLDVCAVSCFWNVNASIREVSKKLWMQEPFGTYTFRYIRIWTVTTFL